VCDGSVDDVDAVVVVTAVEDVVEDVSGILAVDVVDESELVEDVDVTVVVET